MFVDDFVGAVEVFDDDDIGLEVAEEIVAAGCEDKGALALAGDARDVVGDYGGGDAVERGAELVGEDEACVCGECAGEAVAVLLAFAEGCGTAEHCEGVAQAGVREEAKRKADVGFDAVDEGAAAVEFDVFEADAIGGGGLVVEGAEDLSCGTASR